MERYAFIVNPIAGRGRTRRLLPVLRSLLEAYKLSYELQLTSGPGEAVQLAEEAASNGAQCVVAVGGDGTVHEVANGLLQLDAPVALGVIPTGSGNDFCKAISVPLDLKGAVRALTHGQRRRVDVCKLKERFIVNGLGIGLDGAVSHRYRRMKRLRGELGYLWGAIHEALTFRAFPARIKTPDWRYEGSVLFTGVSNGPYHGGDFRLAPHARVDDGQLDVHIVRDMFPLRRLVQIPKVRQGTHLELPEFTLRRAPWVEFQLDKRVPAHMDGEPFWLESGCHRVELLPKALEVIAPHS
jgi:YegS/Rv2252/BmrU family lipid kinase